jgi:hypothetical protein
VTQESLDAILAVGVQPVFRLVDVATGRRLDPPLSPTAFRAAYEGLRLGSDRFAIDLDLQYPRRPDPANAAAVETIRTMFLESPEFLAELSDVLRDRLLNEAAEIDERQLHESARRDSAYLNPDSESG